MTYPYTLHDMLLGPAYHYNFSPYSGTKFLQDYFASRRASLANLRMPNRPEDAVTMLCGQLPSSTDFNTEEVLTGLASMLQSTGTSLPQASAWADFFLHKFEVVKRLRVAYTSSGKVLDTSFVPRRCYAQLAFLLAITLEQGDLRKLNTLLKTNDLVLSGPIDVAFEGLVLSSVNIELAAIAALAEKLRVSSEDADAG